MKMTKQERSLTAINMINQILKNKDIAELAVELQCSVTTIYNWKSGATIPSYFVVEKLREVNNPKYNRVEE